MSKNTSTQQDKEALARQAAKDWKALMATVREELAQERHATRTS